MNSIGLAFLSQVTGKQFDVDSVDAGKPRCAGPAFPQVLANVYSVRTGQPLFAPYHIIDKQITATGPDGKPVSSSVKVGIISFAPPTIMAWDKRWLEGRVYTQGVRETAENSSPRCAPGAPSWWWPFRTAVSMTAHIRPPWKRQLLPVASRRAWMPC